VDRGRNPFEYGRELGADELVDRRDELERLEAVIRNRGKLFLIGPRRFGKTSLLSAADERASRRGVSVLRFDAEKYETLDVLAQAILTAAARSLRSPVEKVADLLRSAASALRPAVALGPDGSITVSLGVDEAARGELPLLTDALDAVEALAAETEREVVVILDEVQQIVVEHGSEAERGLRATVQRHRHVGYVFAGSDTRLLMAMTEDPNRPFYRLGERLFLGAVPRDDFLGFLKASFARSGFETSSAGCEAILELADEVPYNVQRLAHEVWEMLRSKTVERLDGESVSLARRRVVDREDPAYTQVWSSLTRNQKKALKAVITSGGLELQSARVSRQSGLPPSSMQAAVDALVARHLVRPEARAGAVRYRLVDPFMAAWIAEAQAV
jgi:uncharacterized protein